MGEPGSAFVTVVVATRDRGDSVVRTVRTILANDYSAFELRIVDQSDDDRTETSLQQYLGDTRVHYVRVGTKGLSSARNAGIADAHGELIAITDDDCEVSSNWLRELVAAFTADSRIGVVFGNVVPGPHNGAAGFIPAYVREEPFVARSIGEKHEVDGVGACMGLPRGVWKALGGFDQRLGVGAPLRSNSEGDLVMRALRSGYFIYETPAIWVIHHGFRTWREGLRLIQRYWYGTDAMYAKYFKIAPWSTTRLLLRLAGRWAFGQSRVAASLGAHTHKVLRLLSFVKGFAAGTAIPVDRATGHSAVRQNTRAYCVPER
ncbi:MAG TPA: glycosyltransferase [Candidatus Binatia bacterium]|jgi:glycosyltransferase involved in cell wall biosynthesis|nr:glycosyltransferase [Candidatus Binatia bacterium]